MTPGPPTPRPPKPLLSFTGFSPPVTRRVATTRAHQRPVPSLPPLATHPQSPLASRRPALRSHQLQGPQTYVDPHLPLIYQSTTELSRRKTQSAACSQMVVVWCSGEHMDRWEVSNCSKSWIARSIHDTGGCMISGGRLNIHLSKAPVGFWTKPQKQLFFLFFLFLFLICQWWRYTTPPA